MLLQMLVGVLSVFFFLLGFICMWIKDERIEARIVAFTLFMALALGLAFLQRFL